MKFSAPFLTPLLLFLISSPLLNFSFGLLKVCSWEFILSLLINPKLLASRKLRDLFFSAGLSNHSARHFSSRYHAFFPSRFSHPFNMILVCFICLMSPVYFLLVAFNLNIIGILFLFAMLLVSLLLSLLLSSKLKFYLLQSPYFPSLPLFLLCLSLSPLKILLTSSPSSQWKLLCF